MRGMEQQGSSTTTEKVSGLSDPKRKKKTIKHLQQQQQQNKKVQYQGLLTSSPVCMKQPSDDDSVEDVSEIDIEKDIKVERIIDNSATNLNIIQEQNLDDEEDPEQKEYKQSGLRFLKKWRNVVSVKSSEFMFSSKTVNPSEIRIAVPYAKSEEAKCDGLEYSIDTINSTNNVVTARHLPTLEQLVRKRPIWEVKFPLPNGCYLFISTIIVFGAQLVDLAIKALDCSEPELLGGEYFWRSKAMGGNIEEGNEPPYTTEQEAWDAIWKNHPTFKYTNRLDQKYYCGANPDSKVIDPALSALVAIPMSLILIAVLYILLRGDIGLEIFMQFQKVLAVFLIAYDIKGRSLILGAFMLIDFMIYHYSDRLLPNHRSQAKIMFFALFLFCVCGAAFEFMEDPADASNAMRKGIMIFWMIACTLTIACLVSIVILIGLEYRELIDLLSHDYKMFTGLFRKQQDEEEPVQYRGHRKRPVESSNVPKYEQPRRHYDPNTRVFQETAALAKKTATMELQSIERLRKKQQELRSQNSSAAQQQTTTQLFMSKELLQSKDPTAPTRNMSDQERQVIGQDKPSEGGNPSSNENAQFSADMMTPSNSRSGGSNPSKTRKSRHTIEDPQMHQQQLKVMRSLMRMQLDQPRTETSENQPVNKKKKNTPSKFQPQKKDSSEETGQGSMNSKLKNIQVSSPESSLQKVQDGSRSLGSNPVVAEVPEESKEATIMKGPAVKKRRRSKKPSSAKKDLEQDKKM